MLNKLKGFNFLSFLFLLGSFLFSLSSTLYSQPAFLLKLMKVPMKNDR